MFVSAEKCRRHGIAVLFNLIVGFPGEPPESILATLDVAKKLRALGPDFQVALFYYRPYPGSAITDGLARRGHPLPRSLEEWAAVEENASRSPWVDDRKRALIERFGFYQRSVGHGRRRARALGRSRAGAPAGSLRASWASSVDAVVSNRQTTGRASRDR